MLSIKIPSMIPPTDISNISHHHVLVLGPLGRWNCSHHGVILGGRVAMQVHDQGSHRMSKIDLQELLCGLCDFGPPEIGQYVKKSHSLVEINQEI